MKYANSTKKNQYRTTIKAEFFNSAFLTWQFAKKVSFFVKGSMG